MDIPGFYFDKEKNRYFQAQRGAPADKAFSSHDIKRRKVRDEHAALSNASKIASQGRIKRSKILQAPISGGFLAREQGLASRLASPEIFAAGLNSGVLFGFEGPQDEEFGKVLGRALFDVDYEDEQYSHTVRIAYPNGHVGQYSIPPNFETDEEEDHDVHWGVEKGTPTSMCTNAECSRLLITTRTNDISATSIAVLPMETGNDSIPAIFVAPGHTRGRYASVFSSAPANNNSSLSFVCGVSYGIMSFDKNLDPGWITPTRSIRTGRPSETCPTDIMALQFLSETPSVLLSGGRPGLLHINDLRVPNTFEDNLDLIYHPSSITHLKQLDTHRIIVAGLNSSLCQYDLRYRKADTINPKPMTPKQDGWKEVKLNRNPTRSIVQYPDYFNTATSACGFDVDVVSGIVAASQEQDEQHSAIQLFSLNGGHKISSPALAADFGPAVNHDNDHISCVKLARDSASHVKSLFFTTEYTIHKYSWGPSQTGYALERSENRS